MADGTFNWSDYMGMSGATPYDSSAPTTTDYSTPTYTPTTDTSTVAPVDTSSSAPTFSQDMSNNIANNYGIGYSAPSATSSPMAGLSANAQAPAPTMGADGRPLWGSVPGVTPVMNLGNGQIMGSDQQIYTTTPAPRQDNLSTLWSGITGGHPLDAIASNPKGDMSLMSLVGAIGSYFNKKNQPAPQMAQNPYDQFSPSEQAQLTSFQTNFTPNVRRRPVLATYRNYAEGGGVNNIKGEFEPDGDEDDKMFNSGGALSLVKGGTGGQDDKVKANLSPGEYVMDADVVSALGDGNNDAGAKKLDQMREAIRAHKRSAPASEIPPKAKGALAYLKKE